ncbi:MAG: hypothetical protein ABJC79_08070 [Acidimicrobiia bacterium]
MAVREPVITRTWSPAQVVAIVVGAAFVGLGIAALGKTGFTVDHVMRPARDVGGFRHTPLLGATEVGLGAFLLLSGIVAGGLRSLMAVLGVGAAALGVLLVTDVAPNRLHYWLGVGHRYGWLAIVVGAVVLLAALISPNFTHTTSANHLRRQRVVT